MKRAFEDISFPSRTVKPREKGITMMIDWGLPMAAQRDIIQFSAPFVDLAKIAVGISGLISEDVLRTKISTYQEFDIEPFVGGMFLEMAYDQDKVAYYYGECRRVGYRLIEVSDNVVHFSRSVRQGLIRQATEEYGLNVLGEVGSKHVETDPKTLIQDIQDSLDAGAWKVFVEAAEFVTEDGFDLSLAKAILEAVDANDIIFELPGKWLANVHAHEVYRMMIGLVENVGVEVNLGNVLPEDVLSVETLRTGVGVTMKVSERDEGVA